MSGTAASWVKKTRKVESWNFLANRCKFGAEEIRVLKISMLSLNFSENLGDFQHKILYFFTKKFPEKKTSVIG